jgi:hypothetical protein
VYTFRVSFSVQGYGLLMGLFGAGLFALNKPIGGILGLFSILTAPSRLFGKGGLPIPVAMLCGPSSVRLE